MQDNNKSKNKKYTPSSRNRYYELAWKTKDFTSITFDVASVENEAFDKAMNEQSLNIIKKDEVSFNYSLICLDPLPLFYLAISYALVSTSIWNRSLDKNSAINVVYLYSFITFILSNACILCNLNEEDENTNTTLNNKSKIKSI